VALNQKTLNQPGGRVHNLQHGTRILIGRHSVRTLSDNCI
jgi:hypothetical protein